MSIDIEQVLQSGKILQPIISQLLGGIFSLKQEKEWTKYTYNKRYGTTNTFLQDQIQNISTGIFGQRIGPLMSKLASLAVPSDFSNENGLAPFDVGFISSKGQTLSNNFLNYTAAAYKKKFERDKRLEKSLTKDFYTAYYNLTMQGKQQQEIENAINNAISSQPYSVPYFIKTLVDPSDIKSTTENITEAGKDLLQRERISSPLGTSALQKAQALRASMTSMVLDANLRAIGETRKIDPKTKKETQIASYSGFTGKAVSQLSKILAQSTSVLQGDLNSGQIKRAVEEFQNSVQNTAKALMPLRDIFGQDIKAMITTLQSITAQPISRISPQRLQALSRDIVNAMRSNPQLTAGDIARSGKALQMLGMQAQLNQVGMLSARKAGIRFAHFMSNNNITPWGMTTDYFRGQIGKNIIDAQKSQDKQLVSQAFAIWKEEQTKDSPRTIQQFKSLLRASINRGQSTDDFIFGKVLNLGVKNRIDLQQRAMASGYYKSARQQDFSDVGVQGQLRDALRLQKRRAASNPYLGDADIDAVQKLILNGNSRILNNIMMAQSFEKLGEEEKKAIGTAQNFKAIQAMTQNNQKLRSLTIYAAKTRQIQDTDEQLNFINSILNGKDGGGADAITDIYNNVTNKSKNKDSSNKNEQKIAYRLKQKFDAILGQNAIEKLQKIKKEDPQSSTMYQLMFRTGLQEGLLGDTQFQQRFKTALQKKQDSTSNANQKNLADAKLLVYTMSKGNAQSLKKVQEKWFIKDSSNNIIGFTKQGEQNFQWFNSNIAQMKGNRKSLSVAQLAHIGRRLAEREASIDAADTWSKNQPTDIRNKYNDSSLQQRLIMFSTRSKIGKDTTSKFLSNLIKKEKDQTDQDFAIRKQALIDMGIANLGGTDIKDTALYRIKQLLGKDTYNKVEDRLTFKTDSLSGEDLLLIPKEKRQKFQKTYKAYYERQDARKQSGQKAVTDYVKNATNNVQYISQLTRVLGQQSPLRVSGSVSVKQGLQATLQNLNKVLQSLMGWLSSQKASGN